MVADENSVLDRWQQCSQQMAFKHLARLFTDQDFSTSSADEVQIPSKTAGGDADDIRLT